MHHVALKFQCMINENQDGFYARLYKWIELSQARQGLAHMSLTIQA